MRQTVSPALPFSLDFIAYKQHPELSLCTFYLPPAGGGQEGGRCKASHTLCNTPGRSCSTSWFQNRSTRMPCAVRQCVRSSSLTRPGEVLCWAPSISITSCTVGQ